MKENCKTFEMNMKTECLLLSISITKNLYQRNVYMYIEHDTAKQSETSEINFNLNFHFIHPSKCEMAQNHIVSLEQKSLVIHESL